MEKYYDALLKLCEFSDDEIETQRPRIEKALEKMGISADDVPAAEAWLKKNHDMGLLGIRKIIGIWLKECFDLIHAKDDGKLLLFYGFPTIAGPAAAIASASDKVFALCPDAILGFVMGQIFNKTRTIIETAEKNGLPPGHSMCTLQQTRVGGLHLGIIPVPDMVLTSSYFCDMGSKTDELLHEHFGHPAVYVDGSMDSRWGEFPHYDPARLDFLGSEIDRALTKVKDIIGVEVTDEHRRYGATRNNDIMLAVNDLVMILRNADPQPLSMVELDMVRTLMFASGSQRIINEMAGAVKILNAEVQERVDKGIGIVEKGAPRVAAMFLNLVDPEIMHLIEGCGLSVPLLTLDLVNAKYKKPVPAITGEALVREEFKVGIFYGACGYITRVAEALAESNLDGLIWNYLFNCRPMALLSHMMVDFAKKQTDIPILSLESDLADNRTIYSAEAQRTRIETFAEIVKARKAASNK